MDYIIVGGGPCGLTCALHLSQMKRKVLLIERTNSLGGCHRVLRTEDGLFTEHGPRIYSSTYRNVNEILNLIGTSWDETFVPYNFNFSKIQGKSFGNFSRRELAILTNEFLSFLLFFRENRNESVEHFASRHNFSSSSLDYMDRMCRLTDGAGADRYSVFQFLQLVNQNMFGRLYQPKKPNDQHLFKLWGEKLKKNGVKILLNSQVESVVNNTVYTNQGVFTARKILLCIPPKPFLTLSKNVVIGSSTLFEAYNKSINISAWVERNSYSIYIPITFHWRAKHDLTKVWGFPSDDWGVAFIVLSDYMNKVEDGYSVVISTCITRVNTVSNTIGKTALECNEEELVSETFRQLKVSFPDLEPYDKTVVYNKDLDTAYVATSNEPYLPMNVAKDVYYIGTQNGRTFYSFTSMESAVTNALFAISDIEGYDIQIKDNPYTVRRIFWIAIMIYLLIKIMIGIKITSVLF